jgi:hypothetical protein
VDVVLKERVPYELAIPIFFNYRHPLEYYLKILAFEPGAELQDHSISKLIHLIETGNKITIAPRFRGFLEEWAKIDDSATAFRYAGELPEWIRNIEWWIDLNQMRYIMNQLFEAILSLTGFLYNNPHRNAKMISVHSIDVDVKSY